MPLELQLVSPGIVYCLPDSDCPHSVPLGVCDRVPKSVSICPKLLPEPSQSMRGRKPSSAIKMKHYDAADRHSSPDRCCSPSSGGLAQFYNLPASMSLNPSSERCRDREVSRRICITESPLLVTRMHFGQRLWGFPLETKNRLYRMNCLQAGTVAAVMAWTPFE